MISDKDIAKGKVLLSACAIIEGKDNEVLLMYEGDMPYHKQWVLPGGYVRPDETVEQTVIREVEEETGLKVAYTKLIGLYEDFLIENYEPINHVIAAYKVEVVGGRIVFSKEAMAYKWLTLKEVFGDTEVPEVFKGILQGFSKEHKRRFSLSRRS